MCFAAQGAEEHGVDHDMGFVDEMVSQSRYAFFGRCVRV